ncbi:MAG: twitching motility protein PilT [Candidatus Promineifilaceae bacterium]|jgi:twitching motility protein PilT
MSVLNEVFRKAVEAEASDIHLKGGKPPFFRIRGSLVITDLPTSTPEVLRTIVDDLVPAHQREQFATSHRADFSHHEDGVGRFRANVFRSQGVPALVFRHVKTDVPDFDTLRLPLVLSDMAHLERGIILLAGTTGSGKSSTLAAIIDEINKLYEKRIITAEDPIEYIFEDKKSVITQREVGLDTLSFEDALRDLMRQDPDVILVGEMRDEATIRTGIMAAETGHLVMSTVHASSASQAIPRILDVFPAHEQGAIRMALAGTDLVIMCQRLVKALDGGRAPVVEIMINTPTIRKLLEKNKLEMLASAVEAGVSDGMQSFDQAVVKLIQDNTISKEEGLRVATNPASVEMQLKGINLGEGSRILGM